MNDRHKTMVKIQLGGMVLIQKMTENYEQFTSVEFKFFE